MESSQLDPENLFCTTSCSAMYFSVEQVFEIFESQPYLISHVNWKENAKTPCYIPFWISKKVPMLSDRQVAKLLYIDFLKFALLWELWRHKHYPHSYVRDRPLEKWREGWGRSQKKFMQRRKNRNAAGVHCHKEILHKQIEQKCYHASHRYTTPHHFSNGPSLSGPLKVCTSSLRTLLACHENAKNVFSWWLSL